jgi:hypothetical protein
MRLVALPNCFAVPRRPGARKSKRDQRSPRRFSTGVGVLDGLRFVEDHEAPLAIPKPRDLADGPVRTQDRVGGIDLFARDGGEGPGTGRRGVCDEQLQPRAKAFGFRPPVAHERRRHDEEGRGSLGRATKEEQREHLERLAEPHVVGETNA